MKTCTKCKLPKQLSDFNKYKRAKDGLKPECRSCQNEAGALYRHTHNSEDDAIRLRANSRRHYENHKEKELERNRTYRENNQEKITASRKKYQKENYNKCKAATDEWKEKNYDAHIAKKKEWYQKNKEAQKKRRRDYCQTPEGKLSDINASAKRRTIKRQSADGSVPLYNIYPLTAELQQLLQSQDHKCTSCNCDISEGANLRHLDHIQPLSKGGTHTLDNVQWLCATCNLSKGARVS